MLRPTFSYARIIFLFFLIGVLFAGEKSNNQAVPFEEVSVHFEQNATDNDFEVVFDVKTRSDGLAQLTVTSPDGRNVISFMTTDDSFMGIRSFRLESPESDGISDFITSFPKGKYIFNGTAGDGFKYYGESSLSHDLPAIVSFLWPKPDSEDVEYKSLEIRWTPIENISAYILEIEQEDTDVNMVIKLAGSAGKFKVPEDFLIPGTEYKLGIGTVSIEGNISFVETSFKTTK